MLIFYRAETYPVEEYTILLPCGDGTRFPNQRQITYFRQNTKYYDIGTLVTYNFVADGKEKSKYYLFLNNELNEQELRTLYEEIEMLLGKNLHEYGGELESGYFVTDVLSYSTTIG